jgi:hypothetical protein
VNRDKHAYYHNSTGIGFSLLIAYERKPRKTKRRREPKLNKNIIGSKKTWKANLES